MSQQQTSENWVFESFAEVRPYWSPLGDQLSHGFSLLINHWTIHRYGKCPKLIEKKPVQLCAPSHIGDDWSPQEKKDTIFLSYRVSRMLWRNLPLVFFFVRLFGIFVVSNKLKGSPNEEMGLVGQDGLNYFYHFSFSSIFHMTLGMLEALIILSKLIYTTVVIFSF